MKNQTGPGSDGITTEFYKIFWNDIKEYYIKVSIFPFKKENLRNYKNKVLVHCCQKNEKDNLLLENWMPISLLNVDYKITAKTIAKIIKKFYQS